MISKAIIKNLIILVVDNKYLYATLKNLAVHIAIYNEISIVVIGISEMRVVVIV